MKLISMMSAYVPGSQNYYLHMGLFIASFLVTPGYYYPTTSAVIPVPKWVNMTTNATVAAGSRVLDELMYTEDARMLAESKCKPVMITLQRKPRQPPVTLATQSGCSGGCTSFL
jgi:hypothetical protein